MRRAAALCLLLSWIAPAWSEDVKPSHREAAAELLRIMDVMATFRTTIEGPVQLKPEMEPYQDLVLSWRKALPWDRVEQRLIDLHVREYSEEEIRDLIAFYKTPTGRKTLEKLPVLAEEGAKIMTELLEEHEPKLQAMIEARRKEKDLGEPGAEPLDRANRLYDEEKWAEARDAYVQYLKSDPENLNARSDLGVCYQKLGAYQEAVQEFDRVLASDPGHFAALYNKIIVVGFELDRKAEARALIQKLRKLPNPDVEKLAAALEED